MAVRYPDGSFTSNGSPLPVGPNIRSSTIASFLASLAMGAPPLCSAGVDALLSEFGAAPVAVGISDDFVRVVKGLIQPGTSVLFVLDDGGDMDAILHAIRGLGGTVLKTNVDLERAKLIQSTLAAPADMT
ncbi:MAG: DUF1269 domain-containing protein [Isosphaeraceae bacterium]